MARSVQAAIGCCTTVIMGGTTGIADGKIDRIGGIRQ